MVLERGNGMKEKRKLCVMICITVVLVVLCACGGDVSNVEQKSADSLLPMNMVQMRESYLFQALIQASQVAMGLLTKTVLMTDGSGCSFAAKAENGVMLTMDIRKIYI